MNQKTLLITGCSSGIGLDAAHGMRARGWRVFASCRKEEDCARMRTEGFESPRIDYQDEATIHSGLAEVLESTGGTLDALFNNGAFACPGLIEDMPTDALRAIFEANFFGWHTLTRAVLPVMRAQGSGRVVQNSSILGFVSQPWRGAYVSTKFALEGLTDTMRLEMKGTGIEIILIEPGPVTSLIRQNAAPHFERWIDWEASARSADYQSLKNRLYKERGTDRFELPASSVTKRLIHALEAHRPRARYYVTAPTYVVGLIKRIASTRFMDFVLTFEWPSSKK